MTNKAKNTPIITVTHEPSDPPTTACKLSDEEKKCLSLFADSRGTEEGW